MFQSEARVCRVAQELGRALAGVDGVDHDVRCDKTQANQIQNTQTHLNRERKYRKYR
eukprot:COSAG05_NODE_57_length_23291_cov_75.862668_38_plen_57_part_00